jgi:hypothetical protein
MSDLIKLEIYARKVRIQQNNNIAENAKVMCFQQIDKLMKDFIFMPMPNKFKIRDGPKLIESVDSKHNFIFPSKVEYMNYIVGF